MSSIFRVVVLCVVFLQQVAGRCDNVFAVIHGWSASSSLDASSTPKHGKLKYTAGSSWCASSKDPSPYLEVDLGTDYIICAILTLGNSQADQWVKTYHIQTSKDQSSWSDYKEDGQVKVFDGNYDRSTEVKHVNYGVMQGRYLRVLPKSHHGGTCLRLGVYGVSKQECSGTAVGVQNSSTVPDHRFTASSSFSSDYLPHFARLDKTPGYGWTSLTQDRDTSWLQIDLGDVNIICAVTTQGYYPEWTTSYKLSLSMNNNSWQFYKEGRNDKVFQGNTNGYGKVKHELLEVNQAKLMRFKPVTYHNWPGLRVEVYGILQACRQSLGLEDGSISNSSLSASSGTATNGRLYGTSSWCASSSSDYLQIKLGGVKTVTGIATQGDPGGSKYVTSYSISISEDGAMWKEYKNSADSKMVFYRNNKDKLEINWIKAPVSTAYIRVFPMTSVGGNCLRLDLYGCNDVIPSAVTDLAIESSSDSSFTLKWSQPPTGDMPVISYKLEYSEAVDGATTKTSTTIATSHVITGLKPYTNYTIRIMAIGTVAEGLWSTPIIAATNPGGPIALGISVILEETNTKTIIKVMIWPVEQGSGPVSAYQIIALQVNKEQETLPNDFNRKLNGYEQAREAGRPFYITAEIPAANVTSKTEVSVGNGEMQGEYINAKLVEGKRYKLFVRAVTRIDGNVYYGQYSKIADVIIANKSCLSGEYSGFTWSVNRTDLFGVIGALATIIIVLIVTNAVSLWKLRKNKYGNQQRCDKCEKSKNGGNDNFQFTSHDQMELQLREKPEPPKLPATNISGHKNLQRKPSVQNNPREIPVKHDDGQLNRQVYMELNKISDQQHQYNTYTSLTNNKDKKTGSTGQVYMELNKVSDQPHQYNTYTSLTNNKDKKTGLTTPSLYYNVAYKDCAGQAEDLYEVLPSEA